MPMFCRAKAKYVVSIILPLDQVLVTLRGFGSGRSWNRVDGGLGPSRGANGSVEDATRLPESRDGKE